MFLPSPFFISEGYSVTKVKAVAEWQLLPWRSHQPIQPCMGSQTPNQLAGSLQITALADKCERKVDSNESTFVLLIPTRPSRSFFPNLLFQPITNVIT